MILLNSLIQGSILKQQMQLISSMLAGWQLTLPWHQVTMMKILLFHFWLHQLSWIALSLAKTSLKRQLRPIFPALKMLSMQAFRKTPALFEPELAPSVSSGLELTQMPLALSSGKTPHVSIPLSNLTKHDILLKGRTMLGTLQLVKSVTPLEVKRRGKEEPNSIDRDSTSCENNATTIKSTAKLTGSSLDLSQFDLSGLTPEQYSCVSQMLIGEAETFGMNYCNIGNINDLELKLTLNDPKPPHPMTIIPGS